MVRYSEAGATLRRSYVLADKRKMARRAVRVISARLLQLRCVGLVVGLQTENLRSCISVTATIDCEPKDGAFQRRLVVPIECRASL